VQRQLARLAELRATHHQATVAGVEVLAVKADGLADPHPGDHQQAEQRPEGRHTQWCAQRPGRR